MSAGAVVLDGTPPVRQGEDFLAGKGTATVDSFDPGRPVAAHGDADMTGLDYAQGGEISWTFTLDRCPSYEDVINGSRGQPLVQAKSAPR